MYGGVHRLTLFCSLLLSIDLALSLRISRERNREHARRTRLRKKAHIQHLHDRAKELRKEVGLFSSSYFVISPFLSEDTFQSVPFGTVSIDLFLARSGPL